MKAVTLVCIIQKMAPKSSAQRLLTLEEQKSFLFGRQLKSLKVQKRVFAAMKAVPRENFSPPGLVSQSYKNIALAWPGLEGEVSLSQPRVTLKMTDLLDPREKETVLELGTGLGYQAAIIARLIAPGGRVTSIEKFPQVSAQALKNLEKTGIWNVELMVGDGTVPLSGKRKFDKIIATASMPPDINMPILTQLVEDGLGVIPIGGVDGEPTHCDVVRFTCKKGAIYWLDKAPGYEFVPANGTNGWNSFPRHFIEKLRNDFYNSVPRLK